MDTSVLVVLCALVVAAASSSDPDCVVCDQGCWFSETVAKQWSTKFECDKGEVATVLDLRVESTDGSLFKVSTRPSPDAEEYFEASTGAQDTSCFWLLDPVGTARSVYLSLECRNAGGSCPLKFDFDFDCSNATDTQQQAYPCEPCPSGMCSLGCDVVAEHGEVYCVTGYQRFSSGGKCECSEDPTGCCV